MRDTNEYEVVHAVNISMELANGSSKSISSTFKIIPAKSLTDAKKKLDEATPKGDASMTIESSSRSYKHIYVEDINGYIIKHTIYVNKNGIRYKEPNTKFTSDDITPETLTGTQMGYKEDDANLDDTKEVKPKKKKTSTSRSKSSTKKTTKKSSTKSKPKKKTAKSTRTKRTTVEYID